MATVKKYVFYLCILTLFGFTCYYLVYLKLSPILTLGLYKRSWSSLLDTVGSYAKRLVETYNRPKYNSWEHLDNRPLPDWYDEAKIGIFIHWGVYSVPGFSDDKKLLSEWFWWNWKGHPWRGFVAFMKKNYPPGFKYADFADDFTAEFFNPDEWADIFKLSGARYVVLTSKHHDGFANWPSKYSFNWNSNATGPARDIVGEVADSIRSRTNMKFGLYYSLHEWFHPLFLSDKANGFNTNEFVKRKIMPELYEIVNEYKPEVVWSDGDWDAPAEYWASQEFLNWLYTESPVRDTVVANDRWGENISCHHGGFYTCGDRYNPGVLQKHKWENAMTIERYSWGYRRNARLSDYLSIEDLLETLAITISCGGNMLMNVGPTKDGRITPIFEERLRQMGAWLDINGEGIYGTRPWSHQNDTVTKTVWYTMKKGDTRTSVYALLLKWPKSSVLKLGAPQPSSNTTVSMLGYTEKLDWHKNAVGGIEIQLGTIPWDKLPCSWAWVLKLEGLTN